MERTTIVPLDSEVKDIFLIAKLLCINTNDLPREFEEEDNKILIERIVAQLVKIPYIPFPVSLHTVDIAPYRIVGNEVEILMGRKPVNKEFQFLGGFMDPGETAHDAADREMDEETEKTVRPFVSGKQEFLGSIFINDKRYVNSCHKVTTSFYCIEVTGGDETITYGDDIAEVKWFKLTDLRHAYNALVRPMHHPLLFALIDRLINLVRS